ncbi:MAG: CehA/McbA family metallohydrolase [Polyangiaceae bacterium]
MEPRRPFAWIATARLGARGESRSARSSSAARRAALGAGCAALHALVLTSCGPRSASGDASASPTSVTAPRRADSSVGASVVASAAPPPRPHFLEAFDVSNFAKGNLHTHSRASDGDSPARLVYAWYREHGYDFVVLTDHNQRTDPAVDPEPPGSRFVRIPGEEITMGVNGTAVHVNAICTSEAIGPAHANELYAFGSNTEALAWAIRQIDAQSAVALVNHPNYMWALRATDLFELPRASLLEVWSGHPHVHADGDRTRPSEEAIWSETLDHGVAFAPVSVDDTHKLHGGRAEAAPGRGWVQVFATEISKDAICAGLREGRLYASSGVTLDRLSLREDTLTLWVDGDGSTVEFIGPKGVLATAHPKASEPCAYQLHGGESYVRARISRGAARAWTNAYRAKD